MEHIRFVIRNQYLLAGCGLALLTTIGIVPNCVVAQDAKSGATPSAAKTEAKTGGDLTSPEKLIVGTWRGDHSGKVTFNADGTYREFPTWLSVPTPPNPNTSTAQNAHGAWNFDQHDLVITWHVDQPVELPNGQLQPVTAEFQRHYKIARLDGSFLRLIVVDDNGNQLAAVFYRRLGDVTSLVQLKDKAPAEVLRVAELAHMDSDEALLLAGWTKSDPRLSPWLVLTERALSAARGKSGVKELFGFSDDELNACNELKQLIGVELLSPARLKLQGLLAPEEESAVKKIAAFRDQWNEIYAAVNVSLGLSGNGARNGRRGQRPMDFNPGTPAATANGVNAGMVAGLGSETENADDPAQARLRLETISKLKGVLDEFSMWLNTEAFANPTLPAAGPAAPPPGMPAGVPFNAMPAR